MKYLRKLPFWRRPSSPAAGGAQLAPLFLRNRAIFIGDLFLIAAAVLGSFVLRLNLGPLFMDHVGRALTMVALALVIKPIVYYYFGLYRRLWVYASVQEMKLIALAVTAASILVAMVITLMQGLSFFPGFSRSVLFIDWILSLLAVGGLRFSLRILAESRQAGERSGSKQRRALIVGAGEAGALVVRELQKNSANANALRPVCFVDDDDHKQNHEIHGVRVAGKIKDLGAVIEKYAIDEVVIAIPSAPGQLIRTVAAACRQIGVPFRTMPGLPELIGGKVSFSRLREVEISDLLRREPIRIDNELVGQNLRRRRVLVTGAGGSIGSELCRQIARWEPAELTLVGHGENSIFEIYIELHDSHPDLVVHPVIADVRDKRRLGQIFRRGQPQVVFHAAAHKHVALMEYNLEEAVSNNVLGTRNIVELAEENEVERLVMISSDKAVQPSSIMGATKRVAEMIVLQAAQRSRRDFSVVRFGNVLGSRGSIVPLFKRQIAGGGPITITHPDMRRFFMTIPEAVHLVLQAAAMGQMGETYILNMGEQIRIVDLAEDLIRLSGLEPGKDIEIVYTGVKPGEKLSEQLWEAGADCQPTAHPEILRLERQQTPPTDADELINRLIETAANGDAAGVEKQLRLLIPGAAFHQGLAPGVNAMLT